MKSALKSPLIPCIIAFILNNPSRIISFSAFLAIDSFRKIATKIRLIKERPAAAKNAVLKPKLPITPPNTGPNTNPLEKTAETRAIYLVLSSLVVTSAIYDCATGRLAAEDIPSRSLEKIKTHKLSVNSSTRKDIAETVIDVIRIGYLPNLSDKRPKKGAKKNCPIEKTAARSPI